MDSSIPTSAAARAVSNRLDTEPHPSRRTSALTFGYAATPVGAPPNMRRTVLRSRLVVQRTTGSVAPSCDLCVDDPFALIDGTVHVASDTVDHDVGLVYGPPLTHCGTARSRGADRQLWRPPSELVATKRLQT